MTNNEEKKGTWDSDFGISYTIRNKIFPDKLVPFFRNILKDLEVKRILEVGCNRGHNLVGLSYCGEFELFGIDINPYSILLARENKEISFALGNIYDILYKDNYFDLVLTVGVLIHLEPEKLKDAISELLRVSNRYYLMMEYNYDFEEFEKKEYRDNVGLWRGDFKKFVLDNFKVELLSEGDTGTKDGFGDHREFYLFKKIE